MQIHLFNNTAVSQVHHFAHNRAANGDDKDRGTAVAEDTGISLQDSFESSNPTPIQPGKVPGAAGPETAGKKQTKNGAGGGEDKQLDAEEQKALAELKSRDAEVRSHEQAHISAGGRYVTGGPSFSYQTGPDGNRYAVGGEVSIDVSEVPGNPEATIQKARAVQSSANAPANPSAQDRSVAAQASAMEAKAQQELTEERAEEAEGKEKSSGTEPGVKGPGSENSAPHAEPPGPNNTNAFNAQAIHQFGGAEPPTDIVGSLLDIFS